jgi:hypothetical protein
MFKRKMLCTIFFVLAFPQLSKAEPTMPDSTTIHFNHETTIELAFGAVKDGMQAQLFEQYFPQVVPILQDYNANSLVGFDVLDQNSTLKSPHMGLFFKWPSIETYDEFHRDKRFLNIKHLRNDAMSLLSNGHLYALNETRNIELFAQTPYALVVYKPNVSPSAKSDLTLYPDRTHDQFDVVTLDMWSEDYDRMLQQGRPDLYDIYKVQFKL